MTDNSQETLDDQPGTQANADRRAGFGEIFGRVFLVLLAICLLGWFLLPLLVAVVGVIIGFLGVLLGLFFSLGWIFAFTLPIILVAAVITLVIMVARRLVKGRRLEIKPPPAEPVETWTPTNTRYLAKRVGGRHKRCYPCCSGYLGVWTGPNPAEGQYP